MKPYYSGMSDEVLLQRLDRWSDGDSDTGPLIRWAAAHLRGCGRQQDDSALRLLRELSECVTALENRAVRSSGEFHVWAEERMVTDARDAAIERAALPPSTPPALDDHDINCGIDALRLGEDIGCTCHVRLQEQDR